MGTLTRFALMLLMVPSLAAADAAEAPANDTVITPVMEQPLEGLTDKVASVITVEYAPGASTPPHTHPAHSIVYVLSGKIEMQVKGGSAVVLSAGQTFYEKPSDVHVVSRNASTTEPAKFLVVFIKSPGAPLLEPASDASSE